MPLKDPVTSECHWVPKWQNIVSFRRNSLKNEFRHWFWVWFFARIQTQHAEETWSLVCVRQHKVLNKACVCAHKRGRNSFFPASEERCLPAENWPTWRPEEELPSFGVCACVRTREKGREEQRFFSPQRTCVHETRPLRRAEWSSSRDELRRPEEGREESFFPPQRTCVHEHFVLNDLLAGLMSQLQWAAQQVLWATDRKTNKVSFKSYLQLVNKKEDWGPAEWDRVKVWQGSQTQLTWEWESVPSLT